jgi:hypothetical protein
MGSTEVISTPVTQKYLCQKLIDWCLMPTLAVIKK